MRLIPSLISTALLFAMAAPLAAQDTPAEAPAETTTETATGAAPDAGLDMGTPADGAEPQPGQFYIREEFGDWGMRCMMVPDQPDPCELYQLLLGAEDNPVAELTVFPLPAGGQAVAGATVVAPLETLLTERITITVDGQTPLQYEFSYCNRAGCIARLGLTQREVDAFKRGSTATLRIVPAADPSKPFDLPISLRGFTAGFDAGGAYDPEGADETAAE